MASSLMYFTKKISIKFNLSLFHWILLLSLLSSVAQSQNSQLGARIKTPGFSPVIPIVSKKEYSVSFQPFKFGDLGLLSGFNSVKVIELNYGNKFDLIRHDFSSNKNEIYNFEIHKNNRFKAYCFDANFFYVLSKNYLDGQLQYYLDVIDLNTFQHSIRNKLVIKYTSRRDQDIATFQKGSKSLVLVLENRILENDKKQIELFLFSETYSIEKYYDEKITFDSGNPQFGGFYDWGNSYSVIYHDRSIVKTDSGFYSNTSVLQVDLNSINHRKFASPKNQFVILSILQDSLALVSLTSSTPYKLAHPDAISIMKTNEPEPVVVELPYAFRGKLLSFDKGTFSSDLNYKFTQLRSQLYLIESYKSYYNQYGIITYHFGPGLLLKLNDDDDEIDWFLDLDELHVDRLWENQNLACFQTEEDGLFLFYATHSGLKLQRVDISDGSMASRPLNVEGKWLRSNLLGFQFNQETNRALIVLVKGFNAKPFYLSF
jgi:hypothetical protein